MKWVNVCESFKKSNFNGRQVNTLGRYEFSKVLNRMLGKMKHSTEEKIFENKSVTKRLSNKKTN